jgi:hypothetical protein
MAGCISEFESNVLLCALSHCAALIVSSEDTQMQPTALDPEMALHFGSGQHHASWSDGETNVELLLQKIPPAAITRTDSG